MRTWDSVDAFAVRFLPPVLRAGGADELRRAKLCVLYILSIGVWGPGFAVLLWAVGLPLIGGVIGAATLCTPLPLVLLRRTGSLSLVGNTVAAITYVIIVLCTWLEGGLGAPGVNWFPLVPIIAMLLVGRRAGIFWTVAMVAALIAFYGLAQLGLRVDIGLGAERLLILHLALSASAVILFSALGGLFESLKIEALHSLEASNRELIKARDQAQAATRAKSDFLAVMSHEMRTPLHGIFGMTELALDTGDDAERREFIERSRACAETLLVVINDVLDFSRIEAGKTVLEQAEFDPRVVLDGVLDTLATQATERGLELVGWVDELPARLVGDAGRLRQILVNLAGNAVKFTERGEVMIHLAPAPPDLGDPGAFVLEGVVRDTGIGIPPDRQAVIFEAFTQIASWATSRHGGTGLGLAITQRLVRLMGGAIAVESEPEKGSTFRFTACLPAAAPPPAAAVSALPGRRVLVLEENPACREHLAHVLRAAGAEALAAAGVEEAERLVANDPGWVDAVLVGLPPGRFDCVEQVQRLRALRAVEDAPTLVLVHGGRSTLAKPPDLAAVLSKPVKAAVLVSTLCEVVAAREMVRGAAVS